MIPLGVEASTATATAVDGAAPAGFLDGLLAALAAGTSMPAAPAVGPGQMATSVAPTAVVTPAAATSAAVATAAGNAPDVAAATVVNEIVAVADPPVPVVAHGDEKTSVTTTDPAAVVAPPAADDDLHDELPVAPIVDSGTPPVPPSAWSLRARPGRRVALHPAVVELSEAPVRAGSTPQHRREVDLGEVAAVAQGAAPATAAQQAAVTPLPAAQGDVTRASTSNETQRTTGTGVAAASVVVVAQQTAAAAGAADPTATVKKAASNGASEDTTSDSVVAGEADGREVIATGGPAAHRAKAVQRVVQSVVQSDVPGPVADRRSSAATFALIDAGAQRDSHEQRHDDKAATRIEAAMSSTSIVTDRSDPTPVPVANTATNTTTSAKPMPVATPAAAPASAPRSSTPLSLGMIGVDRVRFAREQAPSRAVQRLAIDLDGAQVAVRFRGDRVAVDVLNDPNGNLGNGWARQVERSLDQAVRTVNEPQRGGQAGDQHQSQPGDSGRRGSTAPDGSDERQRRSARAFELFPEEES